MDPKSSKSHIKRLAQDPDNLPIRRPNRLFLSETIPPASHQPQLSQNRTHNLSDRIHEYYENLVKNSPSTKTYPSRQSSQFMTGNLQDRFEDPYLVDRSTAMQPSSSNARQPFTVYVEDTDGAFQRYSKRKPPLTNVGRSAFLDASGNKTDVSATDATNRIIRERSKSPVINRTQCVLCHSSNHSSQNCTLQGRMPAEHDGFFSDHIQIVRQGKGYEENQGDGSEDQKKASTAAFPKKRSVPANINIRCERDVIGQEKSPVSKSHPVGSGALSTSSSNGDTAPRERKKWVRPPLVGQASSSADKPPFMNFDCLDEHNRSLEKRRSNNESLQLSSSTGSEPIDSRDTARGFSHPKSSYFDSSNVSSGLPQNNDDFYEPADHDVSSAAGQQQTSEGEQGLSDSCAGGRVSPSSSVTSSRRLEWDSGADVGYSQIYGSPNPGASTSGLCTIERMALAQGCSVALHLRLDPEGTTVPAAPGIAPPILPSPMQEKPTPGGVGKPTAESTPLGQAPHVAKALRKHGNDPKSVISPIFYASKKDGAEGLSGPLPEEQEEEEVVNPTPNSKSPDAQEYSSASTIPFHRQLSNSMQDLRKCIIKQPENQLLKSQSDPDLSGDTPVAVSKSGRSKLLKEISRGRTCAESIVAAHSISSGSDATLVHVGTEEDLATDGREDDSVDHLTNPQSQKAREVSDAQDPNSVSLAVCESGKVSAPAEPQDSNESSRTGAAQHNVAKKENASSHSKESKPSSSNSHVCSDVDHKLGLHHHFGVLCSTTLGGHIQSSVLPNVGSQPQNVIHGSDRVYSANENCNQLKSREATHSPHLQDSENPIAESTGSSAFHSDAPHDESVLGASTLTGRANSFEYLPGNSFFKFRDFLSFEPTYLSNVNQFKFNRSRI